MTSEKKRSEMKAKGQITVQRSNKGFIV